MSETKKRIAEQAVQVFNKKGFGQAGMLDVSQSSGISRGNLAYHFKDKEAILFYIAKIMESDIVERRSSRYDYPAFANLKIDIGLYHDLQNKYRFIFENNTVLKHPGIRKVMRGWAQQTIKDNLASFSFAVRVGNMRSEPYPGIYHNLAVSTWIITYYWLAQKDVRGLKSKEDAEKMVWSTILPYFTDRGIASFKSFYGENYLKNLGPVFNPSESDFILF